MANRREADYPCAAPEIDCIFEDCHRNPISGKQLARDCIAEWKRILTSQGLATARLS
jgi:hypothetical protein